ncbi:PRAME family member 5-like [Peromyscus maniculatus bairdii]|uniref:PRAME family member 5-like n=1 Tax=Peromyscus maniculatus bairdii TaxID=230844 RepID=UPI003FD25F18
MSIKNTPTLQQLAVQTLLSNQALAISALESMPTNFFPPLFKEAFDGRHMGLLKAMVAAWPFSCLPVGALMKTPDVEALQAVLDGLDMLQSQKVRPRRWKLQVLDLRNVHHDFLDVWTRTQEEAHSTETGSEKQVGRDLPRYALGPRLKVVTDFSFSFQLKEHQTCLLQWAQQRKGSVRLCCLRMTICDLPVEIIKKVLDIFHPYYIEELELSTNQVLPFLGHFASCLGRMRNLHKFCLTQIYLGTHRVVNTDRHRGEVCYQGPFSVLQTQLSPAFLYEWSLLFLWDQLVLDPLSALNSLREKDNTSTGRDLVGGNGCLKTPLETLCITVCQLSQSDLKHLSQCQRLCHLKHLVLNGVDLSKIRPTHLRVLLENVADTLQNLELMNCVRAPSSKRARHILISGLQVPPCAIKKVDSLQGSLEKWKRTEQTGRCDISPLKEMKKKSEEEQSSVSMESEAVPLTLLRRLACWVMMMMKMPGMTSLSRSTEKRRQ